MTLDSIVISLVTALFTGAGIYLLLLKSGALKSTVSEKSSEDKSQKLNNPDPNTKFDPELIRTIDAAKNEAKQTILEAKDEAFKIIQNAEKTQKEKREESFQEEKKLERIKGELASQKREFEREKNVIEETKSNLNNKRKELEKLRKKQIDKLESISALTKDEARRLILTDLEKTLTNDVARKIKEADEKLQLEVDNKAKDLLIDAMHHASTDYIVEYTITTVKLPDEDMKGRIIGKEGRNIRAFEDLTGVNVDFEEGNEIRISSFDAVRREIAKISLEKLLKDGRIHPARIEEIVKKTQEEIQKIILTAGEDLCKKVGVYNLPKPIVEKLGHFKFRTSYGQNMIQHTLEETQIGVKIANEIGADVPITKLACLLHDIGKVVTDKEGNHIELGAEFLRKFNIPEKVLIAVAEHHFDKPSTTEGVIVQIADSISGSRPGARYEDYESFIKRMKGLELTATSFNGVEKAFAISAGREVRVIVKPTEINDVEATKLSHDIAQKIEKEQTFPGTVKIVVIREIRSTATAH